MYYSTNVIFYLIRNYIHKNKDSKLQKVHVDEVIIYIYIRINDNTSNNI